jgi:hypothetical protein
MRKTPELQAKKQDLMSICTKISGSKGSSVVVLCDGDCNVQTAWVACPEV